MLSPDERAADDAMVERVHNAALRRRGLVEVVEEVDGVVETNNARWLWLLRGWPPALRRHFKRVPAAYYEPTDADVSAFRVSCPDGCEPAPEVSDGALTECGGCGRLYVVIGGCMLAARVTPERES